MNSSSTYRTRSRLSSSSEHSSASGKSRLSTSSKSSSATARAKAEVAKACLVFDHREATLLEEKLRLQARLEAQMKEGQAKWEADMKRLTADKRATLADVEARTAAGSAASISECRSSLQLDPTPPDPVQRTRDYVVGQASHQQPEAVVDPPVRTYQGQDHRDYEVDRTAQRPSEAVVDPPAGPYPKADRSAPSFGSFIRYEPGPDPVQRSEHQDRTPDLLLYMARREMLSSSLSGFSDQPSDYRSWKRSFRNAISGLRLKPCEETDMLVKWLGKTSSNQANRLRTAHLNNPEKGLREIWRRLDKCYGSPEVIEESIFQRVRAFPRIDRDYAKLRDLSDLLTELQAAKEDGDLPGLTLLDTARGIRDIVEKLPPHIREQWASHGANYKRRYRVSFPPFRVFASFVEQQADDRNDPSFHYNADTHPSYRPERSARILNRREVSVHKTEISSRDITRQCPIHQMNHPLQMCRAFRNKPLNERQAFLEKSGICLRCCASTAHAPGDCKVTLECAECGSQNHPAALHPGPALQTTSTRPTPFECAECGSQKHPAALRPGSALQTTSARPTPLHGGEKDNIATHCTQVCGGDLMGRSCSKICLITVHPYGEKGRARRMYAVVDDHSNRSLARPEFFDLFGDCGPSSAYSLKTCAGVIETSGRRAQGYTIASVDGQTSLPLPTLIECGDVPDNRAEIPTPEAARHHPHLAPIADQIPELDPGAPILLLLGRDVIDLHKVREHINGPRGAPHAQRLDLGWVIVGNVCRDRSQKSSKVDVFFTAASERGRPTSIKSCPNGFRVKERYGLTRTKGPHRTLCKSACVTRQDQSDSVFKRTEEDDQIADSIEDRIFLDMMRKGLTRDGSNSWVAPLPLRPSRSRLPNNRTQAASRLGSLTRQFKRKPQLEKDFVSFMGKVLANGHAEVAPPLAKEEERWYLPMFGVYHPKKPGKIRVVFDSSAQYDGMSLNKALLTGPDLNNTLVGVLMRFRTEPVAIMADIEQMFYCFFVKPEHRNFLRFLWFKDNDPSQEVMEHRMNVHVFGNSPSPAVATYCLRQSVMEGHPDCSPEVVGFVHNNFYVDDGLKSVPTVGDAISLLEKTRSVLAGSNLRLHKIASNRREVMAAFPPEDHASDAKDLDLEDDARLVQRSLGLDWDPEGDCFSFRVADGDKPYTRRGVLSTINSLYDPLGFVAPVVVQGKFILRELTADNSDWDAPLPPRKQQLWTAWRDSLKDLHNLQIPRTYTSVSPSSASHRQLCVFSDASTKAIAAVAYLRLTFGDGTCEVGFVMGKTKLAPQPDTSVPRLELCAAVLAVELADLVQQELDIPITTTAFFSDSKVVLGYIHNEVRRFYVYVSNRIQRIRRSSRPDQWHYVPTEENPADCGTRSVAATQLSATPWLRGPSFLSRPLPCDTSNGPHCLVDPNEDAEIRPDVSTWCTHSFAPHLGSRRFERFSTWTAATRAIAHLTHIAQSFRKDSTTNVCNGWHHCRAPLAVATLAQAENTVIRSAQRDTYALEFSYIQKRRELPKESSLRSLDPFVDDKGLLRVGGRTRRAGLDHNEIHPIIISGKHQVASLLVRHHHQRVHHQGRHFTEGAVRAAGLWIVGSKRCVSKTIHFCVLCRRLRGPTQLQKMADLPGDRLSSEPPFTNVGLDVFGPWSVTSRRTRGGLAHSKRWAVILTCLSTRAVHIEVLESLDTSSLINALRRFFAIRGPAKLLRSDQGTNFVGASKQLGISSNMDTTAVERHLANSGCTWLFNPPHAPHMGGAWERMIGVTKGILNAMLVQHGSTRLTHEVLTTFMAEVAAIINSRPLLPVSTDPEDPTLLTPATLLTQKIGPAPVPPGEFTAKDVSRRQWRHVQHLAQTFWARWKNQYLPLLQARSKWTADIPNLTPGSVVLLKDDTVKRNEWPLGLVARVIPSEDGKIRQVELKVCRNGCTRLLTRPVTATVLLLPAATPEPAK